MPCQDFGIGQSATNLFEGLQRVSMRRLAQEALAAHPGDTEAALAAYESDLFPRAEQSAAESAANLDLCFAPDAPTGLLNFFSTIG